MRSHCSRVFQLASLTVTVTLITIHAVVDISVNAPVIGVSLRLAMAVGALEDGIVIRVDVARGTHAVCIAVIHGEWRVLGVVEVDLHPI